MGVRTWRIAIVLAICASEVGAGGGPRTAITVWGGAPSGPQFGGATYGGTAVATGALITEQREVDVGAGELRITGVASTIDPASVQLRSVSEQNGVAITEQRFVPGATTPDEILARHLGDTVTVVTQKGDVTGTLRSVDSAALVVEVGAGNERRLQVLHRDGYVQDVKLPAGAGVDKPSLVWRLAAKRPGRQTVEVSYRADGMTWSADYLAILDETAKAIDFSAWATVKNTTGASYDNVELALVSSTATTPSGPGSGNARATTPSVRFSVPSPVRLGDGETVQVELFPPRTNAKARSVVAFEAMPDPSASFDNFPQMDCTQLTNGTSSRADVAIELDVPATAALPDGRVRIFKRHGASIDMLGEDDLHATAGLARMRLASDTEITGERHQVSCTSDEHTRTIQEKVAVAVENRGKQAIDVVVREYLWRTPVWRIDPSDESTRGVRVGPRTQEYRLSVPAGGKKSVTYAVVYSW